MSQKVRNNNAIRSLSLRIVNLVEQLHLTTAIAPQFQNRRDVSTTVTVVWRRPYGT